LAAILPDEIAACLGADEWSAAGAAAVLAAHLFVFIAGAIVVLLLGDPSVRISAAKTLQRWSTVQETPHAGDPM